MQQKEVMLLIVLLIGGLFFFNNPSQKQANWDSTAMGVTGKSIQYFCGCPKNNGFVNYYLTSSNCRYTKGACAGKCEYQRVGPYTESAPGMERDCGEVSIYYPHWNETYDRSSPFEFHV